MFKSLLLCLPIFILLIGCSTRLEAPETSGKDETVGVSNPHTKEEQSGSGNQESSNQAKESNPSNQNDESFPIEDHDVRKLLVAAFDSYWTVLHGGKGELQTFTKDNVQYRYLEESIGTIDKLRTYLLEVYSDNMTDALIKRLELIEIDGRLAQKDGEGGTLLNWSKLEITLDVEGINYREYLVQIPEGDGVLKKKVRIIFEDNRWVVDTRLWEF